MASDFQKAWMAVLSGFLRGRTSGSDQRISGGRWRHGRNLVVSLAPCAAWTRSAAKWSRRCCVRPRKLRNIANRFLTNSSGGFHGDPLAGGRTGCQQARRRSMIPDRTMLTLFDSLSEILKENTPALSASFREEDRCAESCFCTYGEKGSEPSGGNRPVHTGSSAKLKKPAVDAGPGHVLYFEVLSQVLKMTDEFHPITTVFKIISASPHPFRRSESDTAWMRSEHR